MFVTGLVFALLLPSFLPPPWSMALLGASCLGLLSGRLGRRWVVWVVIFVVQLARLTELAREQWPEGFSARTVAKVQLHSARYKRGQGYGVARIVDGPYTGDIQLAWAQSLWQPRAGEVWQVPLKLQSFYTTPGPRDLFMYRMSKGWQGRARVQAGDIQFLEASPLAYAIRDRWSMRLEARPDASRWLGQGLLLGIKPDWGQTRQAGLEASGLGHLFSPSGLHLGIAIGLAAMVLPSAGRLFGGPMKPQPLTWVAVLAMWWVLPTKLPITRASLGFVAWVWNRHRLRLDRGSIFLWVFALCLLIWPAAGSQGGTGLSFGAVGWILVATRCRVHAVRRWLAVLIGLSASGVLFGLGGGILAPVSNAIWVPALSLIGAPALVLGLALDVWWGWDLFAHAMQQYLDWLPMYSMSTAQGAALASVALTLLWPIALPLVIGSLLWMAKPAPEGFWLYSVGAGQAMRFSHGGQHWIIDAAPAQPGQLGAVGWELLPSLRADGVRRLDKLILSHGDADHAGGAAGLLARIPVQQILTGEPNRTVGAACFRDQQWQVGQWRIQVRWGGPPLTKNAASCVLSLTGPAGRILLLGDSPRKQQWLRAQSDGRVYPVDLLVAAHHGARDGYSEGLANAQDPNHVVFSQGKGHRWRHPHSEVEQGWQGQGAETWRLGRHGSLYVDLDQSPLTPVALFSVSSWTMVPRKPPDTNYLN